ncbi:unnamed protein product [Dibothriocephalus latus]|uniref:Uncharacterized protein n=1 Tax=Dibothriocephalus latus TaxID=60516 RepID=A0A3P6P455_DIBLA|nr:unnamed protein product [Dibothriocephalus latus]
MKTISGIEIAENKDKAECFSQFIRPVYKIDAWFLRPSAEEPPTGSIGNITLSHVLIRRELGKLKDSKSPGPDQIPLKSLKELVF